MKRNTVTIIKYLVFAAFFLTLGPVLLKLLFGDIRLQDSRIKHHRIIPKGVEPIDPDDLKKIFVPREWEIEAPPSSLKASILPTPITSRIVDDKIDWHDYAAIAEDLKRKGPGEQGEPVIVSADEEEQKKALYGVNGFNALASDKISLDRAIKDIRHPDCKTKKYLPKLLTASVVVPFHNEHWSTLLRTVKSVLNRSPKHLMHEIILVDDFSSKEHCKKPLDDYLAKNFEGKVKVLRQSKREGLIRTRIAGAKMATGDVIIFLDSHVEASVNWLPPLLEPIVKNYKTVVCPFIDVIDFETFAYRAQDEGARGAFDWEFYYKRLPLLRSDLEHPSEPFKSPVMAGGLFAISAKWFWELGGYDPGLDIWGGEQYELSFKIWQCGGIMVDAPCSRVGHIYRKFAPFPNPGIGDFIAKNYKRVAEVWMDEYKEYLYLRRPHYRTADAGNITEQLAVRERLHCKPFSWFMKKVAFDLPKKYPMVEPPNVGEGEIKNVGSNMCIDAKPKPGGSSFGLEKCQSDDKKVVSGDQKFKLTWHKDIRTDGKAQCFDVSRSLPRTPVIFYSCHGMQGNQWFKYNWLTQQLYHPTSNQCLDADKDKKEIYMMPCDPKLASQKWKFTTLNENQAKIEWTAKRFEEVVEEDVGDDIRSLL